MSTLEVVIFCAIYVTTILVLHWKFRHPSAPDVESLRALSRGIEAQLQTQQNQIRELRWIIFTLREEKERDDDV